MMRRRVGVVVGVVVVCLAGVALVVSASGATGVVPRLQAWGWRSAAPRPQVVPNGRWSKVIVRRLQGLTVTSIDNPPTGTSQGDELAVEGHLVTLRGVGAGLLEAHEVLTGIGPEPNAGRLQLTVTALLRKGQIDVAGALRFNQSPNTVLAIIGGTGKYLGASGEVLVHPGPHRTRLTFLIEK